ncbi:MAG: tetratricopeptide repeat protein [Deltaproteobacteria bacterium]|nr:tetratricopeptide repeat protein [Deltaproteobacteria bacterium]
MPEQLTSILIERLAARCASGELEQASALLDELGDTAGEVSWQLHRQLGELAEQLGRLELAITEYNLALRGAPAQPEVLRRLARLRADRGELPRAERAYRRLLELEPADVEARLELGALLEDLGRTAEATALYGGSEQGPGSARLQQAARRLARAPAYPPAAPAGVQLAATRAPADSSEPGAARGGAGEAEADPLAEIEPGDADLITFASLFAGREGVHARQWASPTGRYGYTPVHEPFTPAVARQHLLGTYTVGIYPVRMDSTAHFLAFDLDVARFALGQAGRTPRGLDGLLGLACRAAGRLLDAAASLDLPALLESSGWKGWHVWLFFAAPIPAAALRRLGQALLRRAGPLPAEVTVELFPKQARVAPGSLGNLIKLPLGVHRVTGRRALLTDATGRPFADQLAALRGTGRVARGQVSELLARLEPEEEAATRAGGGGFAAEPEAERSADRTEQGGGATGAEAGRVIPFPGQGAGRGQPSRRAPRAAALDEPADGEEAAGWPGEQEPQTALPHPVVEPYQPEDDLELQWLAQRCSVLGEVLRRAEVHGVLSNDERLALTYTVGHLATGPQAVNALLARTLTTEASAFLKSRLRGHPMSCPKLRSRLPDIAAAVSCDCRFDAQAGLYPTPLLHLQSLPGRSAGSGSMGQALGCRGLQAERLVTDLYRLRADIERSERLAAELEQRLREIMAEQGVAELVTAAGTLRGGADPAAPLCLELPGQRRSRAAGQGTAGRAPSVPGKVQDGHARPLVRADRGEPAAAGQEASDGRALRGGAGSDGEPGEGAAAGEQGAF